MPAGHRTPDLPLTLSLCAQAAAAHAVPPQIHPQDMLWRFLAQHPAFASLLAARTYYYTTGAQSARQFAALLATLGGLPAPYTLLEFAAGYGCVTRHLAQALPQARLTSCDIHPAAVAFLQTTLGTPAIGSTVAPEDFAPPGPYDVVFALSFFSHMPRATWSRWLTALAGTVAPGGLLVFTTHGWASRPHYGDPPLDASGFWFQPTSEQGDLAPETYGSTIVSPAFVLRATAPLAPAVRLVRFQEAAWWGHQDLYVLRRTGL